MVCATAELKRYCDAPYNGMVNADGFCSAGSGWLGQLHSLSINVQVAGQIWGVWPRHLCVRPDKNTINTVKHTWELYLVSMYSFFAVLTNR